MNKTWKSLAALCTAAAMALAGFVGTSTALADPGTGTQPTSSTTGTIVIKNTVAGDKFSLYRILDIESASADCEPNSVTVSEATEKALGPNCKVVYKLIENNTLNEALKTAAKASAYANPETSDEYKAWMNGKDFNLIEASTYMTWKDVDSFAKAFSNAANTANAATPNSIPAEPVTVTVDGEDRNTVTVKDENNNSINVTTINGLTPGYYLIVQDAMSPAATTAKPAEERTKSYNMVGTVLEGKTFTFKLKNGTVTLTKDIVEGTGDAATTTDEGVKYAVGDDVTFSLTGTMPDNYAQFTKFTYKFTDTLPKGLTYNENSLEVSIVNPDEDHTITLAEDQKSVEEKDGTTTITVKLGDLKSEAYKGFGITKDTKIVVTYSAKVNENAVYKNENKAKIEFSNNPNSEIDTDTASTPEDKSTVFNLTLNVNKTDDKGEALKGAEFTLTRKGSSESVTAWNNVSTKEIDKNQVASFPGLGEGTYKLVETVTPEGYNTIDPIIFVVQAVKDSTSEKVTGFKIVGEDGKSIVDEKGGNLFSVFIPTTNETTNETTTAATATTIVVNKAGSELPSTGGMGTVLLYTVGGLVVLIAAAGLTIALKRRQS